MPTTYAIPNGATSFAATTWTGDGTTPKTITNGGNNSTGTTFQPDLVWIKNRPNAYYNTLYDSVRGTSARALYSNTTDIENGGASNYGALYGYLSAFNSNGFQTTNGTDPTNPAIWVNTSGTTYVAWQWKANGAAVSNTAGTITSQVSADTTAGFSIVTYTGNGSTSSSVTIGHGLGATPAFIITKSRSAVNEWSCWHQSLGGNYGIWLNSTNARNVGQWAGYTNFSSTVFSPPDLTYGNVNGATYVNYLWAEVAGYSKFGSYAGNGSTDGPFVFCGFRPRWVMIKVSSGTTGAWVVYDTSRSTYNATGLYLVPNSNSAEGGPGVINIDVLSNGFKIRQVDGAYNASACAYIYAAFAENPFKYANAR